MSKDVKNLIAAMSTPFFWLSGVLFDVKDIHIGWVQTMLDFNPITFFVTAFRGAFYDKTWFWNDPSACVGFVVVFAITSWQRCSCTRSSMRRCAMSSNDESLKDTKSLHKTSVSDEVVIKFDHVTKTYNLYKNDRGRFLGIFNYNRKGSFLGSVDASKDLSFEIKKGEAVAFLGRNGAGKSTTLKMVTGVTHPTSGDIEVKGRVSALLELAAGFDSQLTGRENINLRGQILGLKRSEIRDLEPRIIEFAELGLYIDQPMRTYSSGMKARLGFAFAVAIDPEILVVDEALSVGDRAFQKKCINRIREIMMDESVTVLFVTHTSATAKEFCGRGIVLDQGTKVFDGSIDDATAYYEKNY